jgi:hypothetical protein
MKFACRCLVVFGILTNIPGCSDNAGVITHDMLVFWNEVCDNMLRATDEDSAKEVLDVHFKILEEKHKKFDDRIKKLTDNMDKLDAKDLDNALIDYYYEMKATSQRITNTQKILDGIMRNTKGPTTNLKAVRDWPDAKKKFGTVQLGKFNPDETNKFGGGLVLPRPQFTKKKDPNAQPEAPR